MKQSSPQGLDSCGDDVVRSLLCETVSEVHPFVEDSDD